MEKERIIIGLVGHPSSGKDTVANYLVEKYGFSHVSTSDMVREYLRKNKGGEMVREILSETGILMRNEHGPDYLVTLALEDKSPRLIVSGLRTLAEAKKIKEVQGHILALKASIEFRYKFARERGRIGEDSFERFKAIEEKEANSTDPNAQNVEGTMKFADYVIENNSDLESLYKQIDDTLEKILN